MLDIRKISGYRMNSLVYYFRLVRLSALSPMNLRRAGNIARSLIDWKRKRAFVRTSPCVARVEPSSVCNLRCPGCATPKKVFAAGQITVMSLAVFKKIYEELRQYTCRMTFYMEGEPTTNPRLFEMISLASRDKMYTSFSTNFTLMRESWLKPLFDSGLDYISVCLDGFTQDAYQQYRINGDVSKVKEGLKMTMDYKRAGGYRRPFVNVYSITFPQVVAEMDQIKDFCKEVRVDSLTFRPDESGRDTPRDQLTTKKPIAGCFWPWLTIQVDPAGLVYPCPIAFRRRQAYGNLADDHLSEIWNNERYVSTREYIRGRSEKKDGGVGGPLPCETCEWYGKESEMAPRVRV